MVFHMLVWTEFINKLGFFESPKLHNLSTAEGRASFSHLGAQTKYGFIMDASMYTIKDSRQKTLIFNLEIISTYKQGILYRKETSLQRDFFCLGIGCLLTTHSTMDKNPDMQDLSV